MTRLTILFFLCFFTFFNSLAQTIDEYVSAAEIDTLLNNGSKDNRINFAFGNIRANLNENPYASKSELVTAVNDLLPHFDPDGADASLGFAEYSDFFNLYSIWFPEPILYEAIPSYYEKTQGIRDALFLPWATEQYGWITMVYTGGGGNGVGVTRERRVGDGTLSMDSETVFHEFNHTMTGVYDEYTASGEWSNYQCSEGPNVTGQNILDEVPWRKWVNPDSPIPTPYESLYFDEVGLFEGNISGYFGCYRPTARSCYMGAGGFGEGFGQNMCQVCLQRFICMLYQYVNVIENPMPADQEIHINGAQTITFSADIVKPYPNTQKYEWILNGRLIATEVESITIDFEACNSYELQLVVTDTTENVRFDEKFKHIYPEPKQIHTWIVVQDAVSEYNLSADISTTPSDCQNIDNGVIQIVATGGLAPYSYHLNGQLMENPIVDLTPGIYSLAISDDNGCSVIKEIEVLQDEVLDFEICSSFLNGSWELSSSIFNETEETLTYLWSNGSITSGTSVDATGNYHLEITNTNGCKVIREISLEDVESSLFVSHSVSNSVADLNNGSVFLDIYGGLLPYTIHWYEQLGEDQTANEPSNVLSSGNGEISDPALAFNNDFTSNDAFWAENYTGQNYLGYDFGSPKSIQFYSITSNVDVKGRDAKSWTLQGSDDGENWSDIENVQNFDFPERLQTFNFYLDVPISYRYARLLFTENWGEVWIAIQQIEFGNLVDHGLPQYDHQKDIQGLSSGFYAYDVIDQNNSCINVSIKIEKAASTEHTLISVVVDGFYQVKIENPSADESYYWSTRNDGGNLLHVGQDFQPMASGQYYVRSMNNVSKGFGSEIKGFSVRMDPQPEINISKTELSVKNPDETFEYVWYDVAQDGDPVHTGIEYIPGQDGIYYVAARSVAVSVDPIDPATISGINLWMDASDLDGNGEVDFLESSSAYGWQFKVGGNWRENNWFPYRSNYQNGLGVVDFSTLWYQYIDSENIQMQTAIIAYKESDFSYNKTAPTYGLKENIPRYIDASQLFSNDAPATTLDGLTYLNGELVDPLTQENPMDFIILSVVFTQLVNGTPNATDENWEGKLGELITWDVALSESQIKGVSSFLKRKWLSTADLESPRAKVNWGENFLEDKDNDGFKEDIDCDDLNPTINPDAIEVCDGIDNNCDGVIDEGLTTTYFVDNDNDGFGDLNFPVELCELTKGYAANSTDCNDEDALINELAEDIPNNGVDENCDGSDLMITDIGDLNQLISVYPNPVKNLLTISTASSIIMHVEIMNIIGQSTQKFHSNGQLEMIVDMSNFNTGVYIMKIFTKNGEVYQRKLIK